MSRAAVVGAGLLLLVAGSARADAPLPPGVLARLTPPSRPAPGEIDAVAVSPDGKTVVAAGNDAGVLAWQVGKKGGSASTRSGVGFAVVFSPDGERVATGGWGRDVRLWEADLGRQHSSLGGHAGAVTSAAFSEDGKLLLSGSDDRTARLWDLAKSTEVRRFEGHEGLVTAVAFGPEGKTVVTASLDHTVRVWDAATGKELRRLEGHRDQVLAVRLLPTGAVVTASMDHTLRLWDTATGKELRKLEGHQHGVMSVDVSADGKRVVSGSHDGTIRLWDAATGKELLKIDACEHGVRAVAFLPDGKSVVGGDAERRVRRWDAATGKEVEAFDTGDVKGSGGDATILDWSPDGKRLVTGGGKDVRVWDAASGKMLRLLGRVVDTVWGVAWSPDGKQVACAARRDGTVHVWDPDTGEELFLYGAAHKGGVSKVAYSPDGKRLASGGGSFDPTIYIWDTKTGKLLQSLKAPMDFLDGLAWSPDGKRLASVGRDNAMRIWDVETGKELRQVREPVSEFEGVKWSPDGRWVATCASGHVAYLWDADGTREPRLLGPPEGQGGKSVAFSRDGRTLAACDADGGGVILFETATGLERDRVESGTLIAFAPEGRRLAVVRTDGVVEVRDVTGLHGRKLGKLTADDLTTLWKDLGGEAKSAYRAGWRLSLAADQAVPLIKDQLRPAVKVDADNVARLIEALDDDAFAVRQRASKDLEKLSDQIEDLLRQAAKETKSLEVRLRTQALLAKLDGSGSSPERLREMRALEVLEHAATPEARALLGELSKGAPAARLTREARETLRRIAPR